MRVRDRVEQSLVVVAHLPEGIPRFWLLDNNALETFVEDELQYGLQAAVEAKILTDVNGTSGIQTQAYATTVLATPRKGLTKLEIAGYAAGSLVLHPMDWKDVELARASSNAVVPVLGGRSALGSGRRTTGCGRCACGWGGSMT